MDISNSILARYEQSKEKDMSPKHERAASVNAILELVSPTKTYDYKYWLVKVGNATYSQVLDILKEARGLESKYSKGGYITNKLKPYALPRTKPTRPRVNRRGTDTNKDTGRTKQNRDSGIREVDDSKERVQP